MNSFKVKTMKCYTLKYFDESFISDNYYNYCNNIKKDIQTKSIASSFSRKNDENFVNGDFLQSLWFPTKEIYDCFISHSKKDEKLAKHIAAEIEKKSNYKCFIDSLVWNRYEELESALKSEFPNNDEISIKTDVYMLLTEALFRIIASSKYFMFLETNNSIIKEMNKKTYSPWLFFELSVAKQLKDLSIKQEKKAILTESKKYLNMGFKAFIDEFEVIRPNDLRKNINNYLLLQRIE